MYIVNQQLDGCAVFGRRVLLLCMVSVTITCALLSAPLFQILIICDKIGDFVLDVGVETISLDKLDSAGSTEL